MKFIIAGVALWHDQPSRPHLFTLKESMPAATRIFCQFSFLFLALFCLTGCFETSGERQARLWREAKELEASKARWDFFRQVGLWSVTGVIFAAAAYKVYRHFHKSNVSKRLLTEQRDYAAAMRVELKAGDYVGVEQIIKGLQLPSKLQRPLNQTAEKLKRVCHLFADKRNVYVPPAVKKEVLTHAFLTYEGLFVTIQKIMLLRESHFRQSMDSPQADRLAAEVDAVNVRLENCLNEVGELFFSSPAGNIATSEGLSGMEGMLSALKDADRLLNAKSSID